MARAVVDLSAAPAAAAAAAAAAATPGRNDAQVGRQQAERVDQLQLPSG